MYYTDSCKQKMIRTLLTCVIVCSVLPVITNAQRNDVQKLADHFHEKCLKNGQSEQVFNKLYADFDALGSYLTHAFLYVPNELDIFCRRERAQLAARANEIANDLQPCLSYDEKYLAGFANTSFNEFVHFLCYKDGKYTKRFYSPPLTQCREVLSTGEIPELDACFQRIFPPRSRVITQKELCSDLKVAKECFSRILEQRCPGAKDYQELNDKLFHYISKPCSACSHYLNISLLSLSVLFSYILSH